MSRSLTPRNDSASQGRDVERVVGVVSTKRIELNKRRHVPLSTFRP